MNIRPRSVGIRIVVVMTSGIVATGGIPAVIVVVPVRRIPVNRLIHRPVRAVITTVIGNRPVVVAIVIAT